MKIGFDKLRIGGIILTAIGGLAAIAGGIVGDMKNEAQIEDAVDRKVREFMSKDLVSEEEETEEEP